MSVDGAINVDNSEGIVLSSSLKVVLWCSLREKEISLGSGGGCGSAFSSSLLLSLGEFIIRYLLVSMCLFVYCKWIIYHRRIDDDMCIELGFFNEIQLALQSAEKYIA